MFTLIRKVNYFINKPYFPYLVLTGVAICLYYKLFIFGKVPFPADLLVTSYSPWFDYFKFPVQNPLISDVFSQFFLWKYLGINSLKSLQWPLWNPYSFTGTPLLATYHSAVFYPLNIFLFLPKYFGWGMFIFSQTILALFGMYLLLSLWLKSKFARLTGAVIFALAGPMTTWLELGTADHAVIWLPYCLFFIERFWDGKKIRYLILLIASQSMLILAGHAQILTYSLIILFIYIFINSFNKKLRFSFAKFLPPFLSLAIGLLLTSIQLLPSYNLLNHSIRLTETYTKESNFGLLPLQEILKFAVADFFGNPVTRNYWGFLNYSETSGFIGILTIPLLFFSFFYLKKNRLTIFFLLLWLFSILLSFNNPLSWAIYLLKIPLLTSSYASRMLFITVFSSAILSAFAINQLISNAQEENNLLKITIWIWAAILGILAGTAISHQSISMRNSLLPFSLISFFLILLTLRKFQTRMVIPQFNRSFIYLILLLITIFDLGRYFLKYNPFVNQAFIFPQVPALQYLQNQLGVFRIGREHAEVFPPNTWIAYNLQSIEGYDPLYLNQYAKFINFLNGADLRSSTSSRYAELAEKYSSPFIDAANVRYFIGILKIRDKKTNEPTIDEKFKITGYKEVFRDKSTVIFENPNVLKRVYFAQSFSIKTPKEIEDTFMTDSKFDPRHQALLTRDLNVASISGKGKVEITKYSPNQINIQTQTNNDEILVLADQYEDGWRAEVDGRETKISPANLIFRAIKIPAGSHNVSFIYRPKSFLLGLKLSLIAFFSVSLISLYAVKNRFF